METKLEHLLLNTHKAEMVSYLNVHPENFMELIQLALTDKQPYSWKASSLLWGCMDQNDKRLRSYVKKIIAILPERKDNQQRELLMILEKMEIKEKYEGELYGICSGIWKQIAKNSSLRFHALKMLVAIANKHPELLPEIKSLLQTRYTNSLSQRVNKSIHSWILA